MNNTVLQQFADWLASQRNRPKGYGFRIKVTEGSFTISVAERGCKCPKHSKGGKVLEGWAKGRESK